MTSYSFTILSSLDWYLALSWSLTVALLLFVPVMVLRCWNSPPVPVIRLWTLAFGTVSWAWIAAHWRAELWKKRCLELEGRIQQPKSISQSRRPLWRTPKSTSRFCMTLYAAGRPFLLSFHVDDLPFLLSDAIQVPDLFVGYDRGISSVAEGLKAKVPLLIRICGTAGAPESKDLLSYPVLFQRLLCETREAVLRSASFHFSELRVGYRERILGSSWQSETLIKRLWMRSRQRPNPSRSAAKSFWNPKSLNASYARLRSPAKPLFQQTIEKAGKVRFPPLSALNVLLSQGDGISGLALWLPSSAFSFSASTFHLKKYVVFLLTSFESIRILSSSQGAYMANKRLSASNYYRSLNRDRCGDLCLFN